ncbi:PKD domain-containing protein [Halomicroarcula sp. F28]|uniref:PA14 domain-containing protein n=1 Tax=Haloarcula salinisoli TaxID=2487746 RepID=UPI001C72FD68|nr:PA14 domain-containing protein [Halomicroarcula salinisoli]MBX0287414.1 PKD domain-containing protein [Halomicroarcula salinisoli]
MQRRAQSESIGVILLTVVIVITVGVGSAVFLGSVADDADRAGAPLVDFSVEVTATEITVTHAGGDVVAQSELTVIVRGQSTTKRYRVDAANVSGDDDGRFEPSERFRRAHDFVGPTVDVTVVHNASNTVLARESLVVGERGAQRPPAARFSASPAEPDPGETVTFDASASSDDGTVAEYRWEFGDGTTATTTDPTAEHTYTSEGNYTVDLTVEDDDGATDTASRTYRVSSRRAPDAPDDVTQGLSYEYYEGTYTSLPDFDAEPPVRTGSVDTFDISPRDRDDNFAFRYTGYVEVPEGGEYTFYTESDDGSRLYIGDELVVQNDGQHSATERSGTIALQPGRHAVTVTFFEHEGTESLDVRWSGPGIPSKQSIPADRLYRNATPTAQFTDDCEALTCTFDAGLSTAPSSSISSYEWDVEGNVTTTSDPTFEYSFESGGSYEVNLTITTNDGGTATAERTVTAVEPRPAVTPTDTTAGLAYTYYEADPLDERGDLQPSAIVRNGTTDQFDLEPAHREENYGFRYTGYVEVPETGNYTFYTTSDDGSRLSIGDELVVQNDGLHANRTRSGEIALEAGKHPITVTFFEHTIDDGLVVEYAGPGVGRQEIPASALTRDRQTTQWESAADWDGTVTSESVVHDDVGDRQAGRLQLGYPTTDRGGDGLVGYWPLDGDGGPAVDASGNGYDGTVEGATFGAAGLLDTTAYRFDDSSWVGVDGFPNLDSDVTISAWIYTRDNSEPGQRIFADDVKNSGGYALSLGDPGTGQLRFYSRGVDPISLDTDRVIENDRWYHVTAVANTTSKERRLYVNGTLVAADSYGGTWGGDDGEATIGGETDDGETGNRFDGRIDEVRVYNRPLSRAAVGTLDRTGRTGSLTTGTKTLDNAVSPASLSLDTVSATRPAGTAIDVTVLSDPDSDGTFEERSNTITLDGSDSYDVTDLTNDSRRYRLEIELSTTTPTATPTVDRFALSG